MRCLGGNFGDERKEKLKLLQPSQGVSCFGKWLTEDGHIIWFRVHCNIDLNFTSHLENTSECKKLEFNETAYINLSNKI